MKKNFSIIFLLLFAYVMHAQNKRIEDVFSMKIEDHMISKGNNFPDFNARKYNMNRLLVALHKGFSVKDFQSYTKYNDKQILDIVSLLESKNWLHKVNDEYKPTIFIADYGDGKLLYHYAMPISKDITKSIVRNLPKIKIKFAKTFIAKNDDFRKWSFVILSNVLLDSWQIDNVEKYFLKKEERPLRNGKNYYYNISESTDSGEEAFKIFGNQYQQIGDNKYLSVYGNKRRNINIKDSENVVYKEDNEIFKEMAKEYFRDLIKVLENNRKYSEKIYSKLGYDKEVSFEEFFIWWYHFIYTQATFEMNNKGVLTIPESGNFDYILME
ncbi:hypothetical protein KRE40_01015 [Elizabethkingia meningoseptica]|uniref:hypothetical protein n=1 Tax=Elizabethkingia meningoseptica TaxID=238 RepID=UPI0023AFF50E|nr:hypothetical protein [Elizabethkingia meningoseptica]MDE5431193.1 hypothetical protein [Elizabethkingia meningoseptica]MDE5437736.1 hypothetical protein [Elizabethkingia meningoseptica]MDE5449957.1 hypothetical protein [Elizabethkingia meningoseptica]MDE5507231.1 hypothetical protein [Elizabethkingia meningoseptica]MDE5515486.1 hypothetical protein [Elizabethkingia meningoseptica]